MLPKTLFQQQLKSIPPNTSHLKYIFFKTLKERKKREEREEREEEREERERESRNGADAMNAIKQLASKQGVLQVRN